MKNVLIAIAFLFFNQIGFAQKQSSSRNNGVIWGPSAGYQYQNGSFFKASGWGLFAPNDYQYMKIDAGVNLTRIFQKPIVIPELGFTYYLSNSILFPFIKAEATPYTLTPKVGMSILTLIDVGLGYGFDINERRNFGKINGFTWSVSFNMPLNFYFK